MACERTSEGICKKALEMMAVDSSLFYTKTSIKSLYFGRERKQWSVAEVNTFFSDFCQKIVGDTEVVIRLASTLRDYVSDQTRMSQLENELEQDMWRLLSSSNPDAGTWSEVICANGHDAQKAIDQKRFNLFQLRDREWQIRYYSLRAVIDQAIIRKARDENPSQS